MAWPDYTKLGQATSARDLQDAIIASCTAAIAAGPTANKLYLYQMIRAHAVLDREHHAHGLLRDLVSQSGAGTGAGSLDAAWDDVNGAHGIVTSANPSVTQLNTALVRISHLPLPAVVWPDYTKQGGQTSARGLLDNIIASCATALGDPNTLPNDLQEYDLILSHAYLDRQNHAHGRLRDLVRPEGVGVGATPAIRNLSLDTAWDHVYSADADVTAGNLASAIDGIDHGGGGGHP